jgi:para-nitrobenzyl esterase
MKKSTSSRDRDNNFSYLTRRSLLGYALLGGAALAVEARSIKTVELDQNGRPIVKTPAGTVRGRTERGIMTFKGIPYGAPTAGENRFQPPKKAAPWVGIRDADEFGPRATQKLLDLEAVNSAPLKLAVGLCSPIADKFSEDCLRINIWAPTLRPGHRHPVMFWCHGQGFSGGSGDLPWLDGGNLARKHDVVVVSINHRLNIFGFLYLGDIAGPEYADSGNVGMLDIVAALRWVRDNIAPFGGDPDNVTIFGQSGGGAKVSVLLAMPVAKGLFHKAIVQSGSLIRTLSREEATRTTRQVLEELKIAPERVDELRHMSAERLLQALESVRESQHLDVVDRERRFFNPVVDGRSLPTQPWDPTAPEMSAEVPLMVGTTTNEGTLLAMVDPTLFSLDEATMRAQLKILGFSDAQLVKVVSAYRATHPTISPSDLFFAIAADRLFRMPAIKSAERKAEQGKAPVFMYLFAWNAPAFGGKYKAFHGLEQPFAFDNLDTAPGVWNSQRDPRCDELADMVSGAWVAFARAGDPNHRKLPHWGRYTLERRDTLLFNYTCEQVSDPGREDRLAMAGLLSSHL